MPYRDETQALRSRVQRLEAELSEARATIARLEGKQPHDDAPPEKPSWFAGSPSSMRKTRDLDFELTDDGYEAVAEVMRSRLGPQGNVSQVGRVLTYSRPGVEMRVVRTAPDRTRVELTQSYGSVAVGVAILTLTATILVSLPVAGVLQAAGQSPGLYVASLPFLVVSCFLAVRSLLKRRGETERAKLAGVFESVIAVAQKNARSAQPPERVRVRAASEPRVEVEEESEVDVESPDRRRADP